MASVLETFFILFKTNADEVEKGAELAGETTDKLESSIKGADKSAVNMGKNFGKLATAAVAAFGSVFAVSKLMQGAVSQGAQARNLQILGGMLGESTEEIRAWGRAAVGSGVEIDSFHSSISGLNKSLNDALFGNPGDATNALKILGVSAFDSQKNLKTVTSLLPELAREFAGLNRIGAQRIGNMLGLDDAMILFLMRGEAHVRAIVAEQRALGLVNQAQRDRTAELSKEWALYGERISETGALIMAYADGPLTSLLRILNEVQDETDATLQGQSTLFEGLTRDINKAIERWEFFADLVKLIRETSGGIKDRAIAPFTMDEAGRAEVDASLSALRANAVRGGDLFESYYREGGFGALMHDIFSHLPDLLGIREQVDARNRKAAALGRGDVTVNVKEITVNTRASDAKAIAETVADELTRAISDAVDSFDDGAIA